MELDDPVESHDHEDVGNFATRDGDTKAGIGHAPPRRPPVPLIEMLHRAVALRLLHANSVDDYVARSQAADIPLPMIPPVQTNDTVGKINDDETFTPLIRLNTNQNRAVFGDFKQLASALKRLAIQSGFEVRVKYSSKRNKRWECRHRDCPFLLSGYRNKENKVHVTDIELMHNHSLVPLFSSDPHLETTGTGEDPATTDQKPSDKITRNTTLSIELVLSSIFESETGQDVMAKDPEEMRLKYIQTMLFQQYGATISSSMASRAKKKLVEMFYEPSNASYQILRPYFEKCVTANPASFYVIDHVPNITPNAPHEYGRCLLGVGPAFRLLSDSAPVIVLEAAQMNTEMHKVGHLLVATTRDYNNDPIFLAMAHVPVSDEINWAWFLQHLKENQIPITKHTTFVTDGSAAVSQALLQVYPYQPHRYGIYQFLQMVCHMSGQARLTPEEEHLILQMSNSLNMDRYMESFSLLWALNKDLCRCIEGFPKEQWVLAAMIERGWPTLRDISLRHCVGEFTKSSLGSLLTSCNLVPCFYLFLLSIYKSTTVRFNQVSLLSDMVLLPYQQNLLNQRLSESSRFEIIECRPQEVYFAHLQNAMNNHMYKIVNLRSNSCTCGDWQQFHIPCAHGLAVFSAIGRNIWECIHEQYFARKHKMLYSHARSAPVVPVSPIDLTPDLTMEAPAMILEYIRNMAQPAQTIEGATPRNKPGPRPKKRKDVTAI
ncbi:hypothetical protein LEN26_007850 [Aphanomyces euteiches]|nr:hypothetical protein AeMF1_008832 [Aphanomyces euteiches]KAH9131206.1 hypothetical protein LEN26_007850 [Aphanomyces euteiches]KAH9196222.1 hypothetical protein AeNC1_001786 [Aphanomyces euteiches]